jgi:predicted RNase H-like HicB family nuclease
MIVQYLDEAVRRARFTGEPGACSATVPGFRGVVAIASTLSACRRQLREVVEEWLLLRVARGMRIPKLGSVEVRIRRVTKAS